MAGMKCRLLGHRPHPYFDLRLLRWVVMCHVCKEPQPSGTVTVTVEQANASIARVVRASFASARQTIREGIVGDRG